MADISKVKMPNDSTTYDIISKIGRGIVRCETDSSSTSTAFVVNVSGITELYEGLTLAIKNTVITSASGCTINVNGLGAKSIWRSLNNELLTSQWAINTEYLFVYDDTNNRWVIQQGYDTNTDTKPINLYMNYSGVKTGEISAFANTFIMQRSNGTWESIVTSSTTDMTKLPNTHGFLLGNILYCTSTVDINTVIGTNNLYNQYSSRVDMRYSFNIANNTTSGFTINAPIYLVGTIGNDGLFYLSNPWWSQTLPSTEDGKLYIYLGSAHDRYRMPFGTIHPIYCYTNGMIRQFAQDCATVNGKALPTSASSHATGISVADHTTGTITGVQSSTTTASKVTLGTAISIPNVTSAGSASNWVFENITVPKAASSATSIPNVTAVGSGSFTQGTFSGGSGSFTATVTNGTLSFSHTHTAATHGADSHSHTAPTLGTAISVTGVSGSTTASHVKSGGNGTAPTLGTAISVPNVTAATDVTVPIKNTSATTVVTSKTHTVTDNGHTHTLS